MNELDNILTNLPAYRLNSGEVMGGVDFSTEEHYAMYPDLKEAKHAIKTLFKQQAELWRDEEYIPIDEFLAQIEKL